MNRAKRWAGRAAVLAVLAAGPGCAMLDEFDGGNVCGCRTADYEREPPPPVVETRSPGEARSATPDEPGVYPDGERR